MLLAPPRTPALVVAVNGWLALCAFTLSPYAVLFFEGTKRAISLFFFGIVTVVVIFGIVIFAYRAVFEPRPAVAQLAALCSLIPAGNMVVWLLALFLLVRFGNNYDGPHPTVTSINLATKAVASSVICGCLAAFVGNCYWSHVLGRHQGQAIAEGASGTWSTRSALSFSMRELISFFAILFVLLGLSCTDSWQEFDRYFDLTVENPRIPE